MNDKEYIEDILLTRIKDLTTELAKQYGADKVEAEAIAVRELERLYQIRRVFYP